MAQGEAERMTVSEAEWVRIEEEREESDEGVEDHDYTKPMEYAVKVETARDYTSLLKSVLNEGDFDILEDYLIHESHVKRCKW